MRLPVLVAAAALASADAVTAQPAAKYPSLVPTFERLCLADGVDPAAQQARLEGAAGWSADPAVTVDVPKLEISRAIERNYRFRTVEAARQWSGTIDGAPARLVLATFPARERYKHLCAVVIDDVENAMPYGNAVRAAFRTFGIGGKSVDLVHYYEFAGRFGADRDPVRGEIFTRSQGGPGPKTAHLYVAY